MSMIHPSGAERSIFGRLAPTAGLETAPRRVIAGPARRTAQIAAAAAEPVIMAAARAGRSLCPAGSSNARRREATRHPPQVRDPTLDRAVPGVRRGPAERAEDGLGAGHRRS
jgi:hypothetical protein